MKNILLLSFLFPVLLSAQVLDNKRPIPSVDIKTLDGKSFNSANFDNGGKPMIINFWATWCKPCIAELTNIDEVYEEWIKETGVKVIAVSIDDSRNATKVAPFVNGRGWSYEVYLDPNSDLKRALNVNNPPQTFLINGNKEIVWQHNGYTEGSEKELFEMVKKLAKGKPLTN
jgi:cytochrome c biogenesis protein CcmG/thiol:disulfide interchange protein DsbE